MDSDRDLYRRTKCSLRRVRHVSDDKGNMTPVVARKRTMVVTPNMRGCEDFDDESRKASEGSIKEASREELRVMLSRLGDKKEAAIAGDAEASAAAAAVAPVNGEVKVVCDNDEAKVEREDGSKNGLPEQIAQGGTKEGWYTNAVRIN